MSDIVERLRDIVSERKTRGSGAITTINPNITGWLEEAADEIEQLRAALQMIIDDTNNVARIIARRALKQKP